MRRSKFSTQTNADNIIYYHRASKLHVLRYEWITEKPMCKASRTVLKNWSNEKRSLIFMILGIDTDRHIKIECTVRTTSIFDSCINFCSIFLIFFLYLITTEQLRFNYAFYFFGRLDVFNFKLYSTIKNKIPFRKPNFREILVLVTLFEIF